MKKTISIILSLILLLGAFPATAFAAFDQTGLMVDGKAATIKQIESITGYSFLDSNGDYAPLYYDAAKALWEKGLLLGSDGSFNLDKPITRAEGIVMTLRLLGLESEAKAANLECKFTDVPDWAKAQVAYAAQKGITSGYSATMFGSSDPMTANQYITFVLRAMGYKDGTDFEWQNAADKALAIGLIGQPCHTQYTRSNLFLRDNVAVISLNALTKAPMKSGGFLIDTIKVPGKPTGTVPAATKPKTAEPSTPPIQTPGKGSETPVVTRDTNDDGFIAIKVTDGAQSNLYGIEVTVKYLIKAYPPGVDMAGWNQGRLSFSINDEVNGSKSIEVYAGKVYEMTVTFIADGSSKEMLDQEWEFAILSSDDSYGGSSGRIYYVFTQHIAAYQMGKVDSVTLVEVPSSTW